MKFTLILKQCAPDDMVVFIGGYGSERKIHKFPNLKPENCYYIDPLYGETKGNLFSMVISDEDGTEAIYVSQRSLQRTSFNRKYALDPKRLKIKAITLDNFYRKCNLDNVKWLHCNAEGAEYRIIKSTDWIDKTENIWIDFHRGPKVGPMDWKDRMDSFEKLLKEWGFQIFTWVEDKEYYDILVAKRGVQNDQNIL